MKLFRAVSTLLHPFLLLGPFFGLLLFTSCEQSFLIITELKCEYRIDPLGIDNTAPRLSWKLIDDNQTRGQKQTAYQILVASTLEKLENNTGDVWDSGKVEHGTSTHVPYQGKPLKALTQYFWKVKIWDESKQEIVWSKPQHFKMGLLKKTDWGASKWITLAKDTRTSEHRFRDYKKGNMSNGFDDIDYLLNIKEDIQEFAKTRPF